MELHKFFVSCVPGFETQLSMDLEKSWPFLLNAHAQFHCEQLPEWQFHKGGIEFETSLLNGFQLNFFLKTAHRVILRLGSFKASRFDLLQKDARQIRKKWNLDTLSFRFKVETYESRLNHKRNIEEALNEVFKTSERSSAKSEHLILVRIVKDRVTLSLDTTGEHLHKRGWGTHKEVAPLRETLAHLMIQELVAGESAAFLRDVHVVDPFAGSGTLLVESAAFNLPLMERSFAFQDFPFCPKLLKSSSLKNNYLDFYFGGFKKLLGCDLNEKETHSLKANLASVQKILSSWNIEISFSVNHGDSFESEVLSNYFETIRKKNEKIFLVSNLPYGERIKKSRDFEDKLVKLVEKLKPQKACFVGKGLKGLKWEDYKVLQLLPLSNQGISVELLVIGLDV